MNKTHFILVILLSGLLGQQIFHERNTSAPYGISFQVEAFADILPTEFHRFSLLYRPDGNEEYIEAPMMVLGESKYFSEIPGDFMKREKMEYYLLLELSDQREITYPKRDAKNNPVKLIIDGKPEDEFKEDIFDEFDIISLQPKYTILSPQPGESIKSEELCISLSYFQMEDIDPKNIKVILDSTDVSRFAKIDSTFLIYPQDLVNPGYHNITVLLTNIVGQKFDEISWNFKVIPDEKKRGSIIKKQSALIRTDYSSSKVNGSNLTIRNVNFRYNIDFDWLRSTSQMLFSSLENENTQPRNRYLFHFANEIIKLDLGDSYPVFDEYGFNGSRVRGVNFSLSKGAFFINIVNGQTAREVQGDPNNNAMIISDVDTTYAEYEIELSRFNYTFRQDIVALKAGVGLRKKFKWDMNFIHVKDLSESILTELPGLIITIPESLEDRINADNSSYFDSTLSLEGNWIYSISYDTLMENFNIIFPNDSYTFSGSNWAGSKPRDNLVVGSNITLNYDDSRIQIKQGFSFSLLNQNTWNPILNIAELDTMGGDSVDGTFMGSILLDTTLDLSQYEPFFKFGINQVPLVPFNIQSGSLGITGMLNMPSLIRYSKLRLRYLGHLVELGTKRVGPDYFSMANPYLRKNYKETFVSDQTRLFENKIFLFFKWSKVTDGIYLEEINPTVSRNYQLNIALYPGPLLPTFNIGFKSSNRDNGLQTLDILTYDSLDSTGVEPFITDTLDRRENAVTNQFNITMTEQFQLAGSHAMSFSIFLYDRDDLVAKSRIQSVGYIPKNVKSESYGISLKSIYNKYWESMGYFNSSYFNFGLKTSDSYEEQRVNNYDIRVNYNFNHYLDQIKFGISYSEAEGADYSTQYGFRLGAEKDFYDLFYINLDYEYRIKFLGQSERSLDDSFFKAKLVYNFN